MAQKTPPKLQTQTTVQAGDLGVSWRGGGPLKQFDLDLLAFGDLSNVDPAAGQEALEVLSITDSHKEFNRPGFYNYDPLQFYRYRAKAASSLNSAVHVRVGFFGDSETMGLGSVINGSYADGRFGSYPSRMASLITTRGRAAQVQNFMGDANSGPGSYSVYDPRLALGAGWGLSGGTSFGGFRFENSTTTNALAFGINTVTTDSADVYYIDNSGVFTIDIGGGVLATVTGAGTGTVKRQSVTFTRQASNVVYMRRVSGTVDVIGADVFDSVNSTISMLNMGQSGADSATLSRSTFAADPNYPGNYGTLTLDMAIVMMGVNDAYDGVPVATFKANMTAATIGLKAYSTVVLVSNIPFSTLAPPLVSLATQRLYADALKEVAQEQGVAFYDMFARFGSYGTGANYGFYGDLVHPSSFGYTDIASALHDVILNP